MDSHRMATEAMNLSREISLNLQPMLKGRDPAVQGAVLADLAAIWLAGWPPAAREELLDMHVQKIRELIDVNEKIIFGEKGHPQRRRAR
jgi:hypothetical protein